VKRLSLIAFGLTILAASCGQPAENHDGKTPVNGTCFDADLSDAPALPPERDFQVTGIQRLEPPGMRGLVLFFEGAQPDQGAARVRLTPVRDCAEFSASPIWETDGVSVYDDSFGSFLRYKSRLKLGSTFVETSMSWPVEAAPTADERLDRFSDWIALLQGS
jgi:hypothetical protein